METKKRTYKFVFFGKNKEIWDQTYLRLIENNEDITEEISYWYIKTRDGKEYKIRDQCINDKGEILNNNQNILTGIKLRKFCESEEYKKKVFEGVFPENYREIDQNQIVFRNFIRKFKIKIGYSQKVLWSVNKLLSKDDNNFVAFIIYNNDVIGYAIAENLKKEDIEGEYIAYSTRGYISSVKIRHDFQNKHLCTPLVTFLVNNMKNEGIEKIFIENASITNNGISACFCYYKAGINNNYNMYYQPQENQGKSDIIINKMNKEYCLTPGIKTRYYYISKNIGKTAKRKIKKVKNSISFITRLKKKAKKK